MLILVVEDNATVSQHSTLSEERTFGQLKEWWRVLLETDAMLIHSQ